MRIVWTGLKDYPGYELNRLGEVRNTKTGKLLKPWDDSRGYLRVTMHGKNVKLHTLVAKTYIPNPDNLPLVNHKRGNKHDPRASLLEWCSHSENTKHAYTLGLCKKNRRKCIE